MVTAGASALVPVREAPAEACVTVTWCVPAASVAPDVTAERPMAPAPLVIWKGPVATGLVSEPTVPDETTEAALATLVTTNRALPGWAPGPVVTVARADAEEVAVVLPQADCWVIESGTK